MASGFLVYGSYGYTGELIVGEALRRGLRPILAGRDRLKLYVQSERLGLTYRAFSLLDSPVVDAALSDLSAVLHCAGPFSHTYQAMVDSCLRTRTHYLDITGEPVVFEGLHGLDARARTAGVMLLPGVGYSVVPSDCLAARLKARLPSATRLSLAFQAVGQPSKGTANTALEVIRRGALARQNGVLTEVPWGAKRRTVDLGGGEVETVCIPAGDLITAFRSTGIPNIEVFAALPTLLRAGLTASGRLGGLVRSSVAQYLLGWLIEALPSGPSEEERVMGESRLWGEARDNFGRRVVSMLRGPEVYDLTALAAMSAMERVLAGELSPGFQTPSTAYGADFVLTVPGITREDVI